MENSINDNIRNYGKAESDAEPNYDIYNEIYNSVHGPTIQKR